jgi:hypothetical protein
MRLLIPAAELHLPPIDARLFNPGERIPTPQDPVTGLVDLRQLVRDVDGLIDPNWEWGQPAGFNVHHSAHPWDEYQDEAFENSHASPQDFRNLPINKAIMSASFHVFLHMVTERPYKPPDEIMKFHVDHWNTIAALHTAAYGVVYTRRLERGRMRSVESGAIELKPEFNGEDLNANEYFAEQLERKFGAIALYLEKLAEVPPEFRIFDVQPDDPIEEIAMAIRRRTSKFVKKSAHYMKKATTQRAIHYEEAA